MTILTILIIIIVFPLIYISSKGISSIFSTYSTKNFILGFFLMLGIIQLFSSPFLLFNSKVFFIFLIILLVMFTGFFTFLKKLDFNINKNYLWISIFLVFIVLMSIHFYNSSIGIEFYDSHFYMSLVNSTQINEYVGLIDYSSGKLLTTIDVSYNYQTYYIVWALILKIVDFISISLLNVNFINIGVFLWVGTLLNYVCAFSLYKNICKYFKCNNYMIIFGFVCVLMFFSSFYYNSQIAFIGNNFRNLGFGLLMFEMYKAIEHKDFELKRMLYISLLSFGLISVSSSSFSIGIVLNIGFIILLLKNNKEIFIIKINVLIMPYFMFAVLYLNNLSLTLILILALLVINSGLYTLKKFNINFDNATNIVFLLFVGMLIIVQFVVNIDVPDFFAAHSAYDMVFNLTYFDSILNILIVLLLTFGGILLHRFNKGYFMIILIVLCIYNPLTYKAVALLFSGVVHYRIFDLILNPFNLLLAFILISKKLENRKLIRISVAVICLLTFVPVIQNNFTYHLLKISDERDWNHFNKIDNNANEMLIFLKGHINSNSVDKPTVISQFLPIKGYISNIQSLMSYWTIRHLKPDYKNKIDDEIIKSFYPTLNAEIDYFEDKINYEGVIEIIEHNKPSYVIINKNSHIVENGEYIYLNNIVYQEFANNIIFDNSDYVIYYFDNTIIDL